MTIGRDSGLIQWTPDRHGRPGSVTVEVTDAGGKTAPPGFHHPGHACPAPRTPPRCPRPWKNFSFLYEGNSPIQTGVDTESFEARRIAVVRGRVLDASGAAPPGATVTIKDHPEFGQTLSRDDGWFDLAVNGGGVLVVNYAMTGRLPAQRIADVPWNDFEVVDDTILLALDDQATEIDLSDPDRPCTAGQGSLSQDAAGSRQATVLFSGRDVRDHAARRRYRAGAFHPDFPGHGIHRGRKRAQGHARAPAADLGVHVRRGTFGRRSHCGRSQEDRF